MSRFINMPKDESPKPKTQTKPYNRGANCTLTCEPRTVYPKKDGVLDMDSPTVSKRWLDCVLKCDIGDGERKDIWLPRETALKGKAAVGQVKQMKFFLFGLKQCSCGLNYHSITKLALDI